MLVSLKVSAGPHPKVNAAGTKTIDFNPDTSMTKDVVFAHASDESQCCSKVNSSGCGYQTQLVQVTVYACLLHCTIVGGDTARHVHRPRQLLMPGSDVLLQYSLQAGDCRSPRTTLRISRARARPAKLAVGPRGPLTEPLNFGPGSPSSSIIAHKLQAATQWSAS